MTSTGATPIRLSGRIGTAWHSLWTTLTADDEPTSATTPRPRDRWLTAIGIGLASAALAYYSARRPGAIPDFLYPWTGARLFLGGSDPYQAIRAGLGGPPPYDEPLFYPFTTLLALVPVARLGYEVAGAIVFGVSAATLAFLITRDGLWRIHLFASAPFVSAALLVQFSPLVMAAALLPSLGLLATLKPNLGLAILASKPSRVAIVGCVAFVALSLVVFPGWPASWFASAHEGQRRAVHPMPVLQIGGVLLLLAALRWRRRSGRLLLAMSLVPQALYFYDQLPLWLIPRTRNQSILLTACSQLAFILWFVLRTPGDLMVASAHPYVMALIYLPALGIVLRQPNTRRAGDASEGPGGR